MIISGIDFSLSNCGIVTYSTEDKKFRAYLIKSKSRGLDRISEIAKRASAILSNSDEIMIEGYAGINNNTLPPRCEAIGAMMHEISKNATASGRSVNIYELPPASLKLTLTGYGSPNLDALTEYGINPLMASDKANKEIVKKALERKLKFSYPSYDLCDALGLCLILTCILGYRNEIDPLKLDRQKRNVLDKIYFNKIGDTRRKDNTGINK